MINSVKGSFLVATILFTGFFTSCDSEENEDTGIEVPTTYVFEREGASSVSFGGQSTRIAMSEEIASELKISDNTAVSLLAMYNHEEGVEDFTDPELNESSKNVRSKSASSVDYYSNESDKIAEGQAIKEAFDLYITSQVEEVFTNWEVSATTGVAGQIRDGESVRYVNAQGLEYNQAFAKSLIGALMTDQIVNNYLSTAKIDGGDNVLNNDEEVVEEGKTYTTMEHNWDEAYGYLYGAAQDETNPNLTLGDDSFLNKYLGSVDSDEDFAGIADEVFQAFLTGRAAIVAGDYNLRNDQIEIIREKISLISGVRAVHYLQGGKSALNPDAMGTAFHELSEGYGFVYSLQFTQNPATNAPYISKEKVDGYITKLMAGNGFWEVTPATLDEISEEIAAAFGFTVEQASN
ncbi:MAG: DUF4856 domain-containing protein [Reichenbachiella sp.]